MRGNEELFSEFLKFISVLAFYSGANREVIEYNQKEREISEKRESEGDEAASALELEYFGPIESATGYQKIVRGLKPY